MKHGSTVHDKGAVKITAINISFGHIPLNAAHLETNSYFCSKEEPGEWIFLDVKILKINPMHYTIWTYDYSPIRYDLKSWVVEASWTEIDQEMYNNDLNDLNDWEL
jgi:hypothetical protein